MMPEAGMSHIAANTQKHQITPKENNELKDLSGFKF
jgi:hypothetical protein